MFKYVKNLNGQEPMLIKMTAVSGTYVQGEALKISSGKLTKATGGDIVEYICAEYKTLASAGQITVYAVTDSMIFEVPIEDYDTAVHAVGLRAQLYSDGLQITDSAVSSLYGSTASASYTSAAAIPSKGGAYIVDMTGVTTDGDCCLVRLNYLH